MSRYLIGLIALIVAGCSTSSETHSITPIGAPLAVVKRPPGPLGGADSWGGQGPLRIGDRCIVLRRDDSGLEQTLVWMEGSVEWDAKEETVTFAFGNEPVELRDGDPISIGGSTPESPDWLVPPDGSCPSELFQVSSIERMPQP
jgi:hypothetical protein